MPTNSGDLMRYLPAAEHGTALQPLQIIALREPKDRLTRPH